jgi:hypothetical protein
MLETHEGKVAFACIHRKLRWRGESTGYFVLAFQDGAVFLSRHTVSLVDAYSKPVRRAVEIPPGSEARVRWRGDRGIRWMTAIQIVRLNDDDQNLFEPVEGADVFSAEGQEIAFASHRARSSMRVTPPYRP